MIDTKSRLSIEICMCFEREFLKFKITKKSLKASPLAALNGRQSLIITLVKATATCIFQAMHYVVFVGNLHEKFQQKISANSTGLTDNGI